jgi:hypothetical protein
MIQNRRGEVDPGPTVSDKIRRQSGIRYNRLTVSGSPAFSSSETRAAAARSAGKMSSTLSVIT